MARSGGKILVVEDEPLLRDLALEMLSDTGYSLYEASSADEALVILRQHNHEICLVFTDVNMAGSIDGLGLAQVISTSWPDIAILITSGRGAPRRDELPSGAVFTPKPWRRSTLLEQVQAVCAPQTR
jgi:two-component system, response regulator PdtaR